MRNTYLAITIFEKLTYFYGFSYNHQKLKLLIKNLKCTVFYEPDIDIELSFVSSLGRK